ncbi:MAG: uroporphyrinogen-III synthase [Variovorax sp.]
MPASAIDAPSGDAAQFDSEALWTKTRAQLRPGTRVLMVRGGDAAGQPTGRDWLAREIAAAGGVCDTVVSYRRLPALFGEAERLVAVEGAAGHAIWLFSSSEAVANLRRALPVTHWGSARAIATHPRIAQAAREAGFGDVRVTLGHTWRRWSRR